MNIFNFFKHKKDREPKTYEGKFVSDDEISMMINKNSENAFITKELNEIHNMMKKLKQIDVE